MTSPDRLTELEGEPIGSTQPAVGRPGSSSRTGAEARAPFVVFTTQRSGSTWVVSVLNTYDGVTGQGELFLRRPRSPEKRWDSDFAYSRYVESKAEHGSIRPRSVFRYLDTFFAQGEHVGFKLMYDQLRAYPEILVYLLRKRVRVVHLVRENHLDVLISFALKREIGRAHVLEAKDRPRETTVELPAASLVRKMRWLQFKHDAARRLLRASRLPHVEVSYEELVRDPGSFDRVLDFLGISAAGREPRSHILKTRVGGQRDVVANYEEVERALVNSRFAGLLE
jgi:LPS sulfotransferase NodH